MSKPPPSADGLDITRPDELTQAEVDAFRAYYSASKGEGLPGLEFWFDVRPDVLKRYRLGVRETGMPDGRAHPLMRGLSWLQYYTCTRYEDGIRYQLRNVRAAGATRPMVIDGLAIAFLHSGPPGIDYVVRAGKEFLATYEDPPASNPFPEAWSFDPHAFDCGVDFSVIDASPADIERIQQWYLDALGEIPGYVTFLAAHQPNLLKAYRNRFEHAIRDALPKQMMAYMLLNHHVVNRFGPGIREAVLLGRWMGMSRGELLDSIMWGFFFGGVEAFGLVNEVAGDLLMSIDGARP